MTPKTPKKKAAKTTTPTRHRSRPRRAIVPIERIERSILLIRGEKVMLDVDLAPPYGVEPKRLLEAVRRNLERFPPDFMFQL